MGKKRIIAKSDGEVSEEAVSRSLSSLPKTGLSRGVLHVQATYNNTILTFTDTKGNVLFWSSSGTLGFKGAKKGTPFAAAKVGEILGEKAIAAGINDIDVVVRGVGAWREAAIRAMASKGINVSTIQDKTPVPHNGPRPKKARRV